MTTGIVHYLILAENKILGVTPNPSLQVLQKRFGDANFPDENSAERLLEDGLYTSPLGIIFTTQTINYLGE